MMQRERGRGRRERRERRPTHEEKVPMIKHTDAGYSICLYWNSMLYFVPFPSLCNSGRARLQWLAAALGTSTAVQLPTERCNDSDLQLLHTVLDDDVV